MTDLYLDADACPVKEEAVRVAVRYGLKTFIVSNQGMRPIRQPGVQAVTVGPQFDAADDWIAERVAAGDIVVTNDIQLAARCLERGALALSPSGKPFTPDNIGSALASRALNQYLREAGEIAGGNAAFTPKDRSRFLQELDGMIQKLRR